MIEGHRAAVDGFGADARRDTLERAAGRVEQVRHELSADAEYLADGRSRLGRELAAAAAGLRAGVEKLAPPEPTAAG